MSASVDIENVIAEVFNPEPQASHAELTNGLEFVIRKRPRLAFKSDFLRFCPRQDGFHFVGEKFQLRFRKIGRCAAAKINELRFASIYERARRIKAQFSK